ncbi:MAG: threonine synthase [Saprospiraceae bacterium]|nr:threonine synthase [Saprospiraceae bacterium]MDW8483531.1 threonine synthase [Saprospiraceae bacterium]
MELYSTNNPHLRVTFREAVFQGLPPDNGLFMPVYLPRMPQAFIEQLYCLDFEEIAFQLTMTLVGDEIPEKSLRTILHQTLTFPAPVVQLNDKTGILELFHGPSLAFKDFGARFMAQVMAYFQQDASDELIILVATSGDTGGAVAAGFYQTPGIRVVILYPSGKVSPLQEKQLTALEHNITAVEIEGTFDDCQALVKKAFLDKQLRQKLRLSSANSINIARLLPQIFYYWEAYKQVQHLKQPIVFSVPSGNFGNLTAGLIAQQMGLPAHHFIAATNVNDTVPVYLKCGHFEPKPSVRTISNAMDVGNPSNFARMLRLYGSTWNIMRSYVSGFAFTDAQTRACMKETFEKYQYMLDPHTAIGYLGWKTYQEQTSSSAFGIVLGTAHPAKFQQTVEEILQCPIPLPPALKQLLDRPKHAIQMPANYSTFRKWLLDFGEKR